MLILFKNLFLLARKIFSWFILRLALLFIMIFGTLVGYFYFEMPSMVDLLDARDRGSVTFLDKNDNVFAWQGKTFEGSLRSETVSPFLRKAIIAVEDKGFFNHFGISPRGILGAIRINIREGRGPFQGHGGSTITQQVAKLLCLLQYDNKNEIECRKATLARKLMEIPFALAMELKYTKAEILSIYLNRVYLGAGAYGFEAAAQRYFNKSAREVDLPQSAMLAGLLKAPSRFAPTSNLEKAKERAAIVLKLMEKENFISHRDRLLANKFPAELSNEASKQIGGYFVNWIMGSAPKELASATSEDVIIRTSFDPEIQQLVEKSTKKIFENFIKEDSKAEIAVVVMSKDGLVRGMLGGKDFSGGANKFNRAVQALRQPGSAFKPFVYAAALDQGYSPNAIFFDEPIEIQIDGSSSYRPKNYTGEFIGPVTLNDALGKSINTVAVQLATEIGIERIRAIAKDFGIRSSIGTGPAVALGASEVNLLELTAAYAGFLSRGKSVNPIGWLDLKVRGDKEVLMSVDRSDGHQVIDNHAGAALLYMLRTVVETGTGKRARIPGLDLAGKTGTSQSLKDAWFIGFNAEFVCGVWIGNDDNTSLEGVTGGGLPAQLWSNIMVDLTRDSVSQSLPLITPEEYEAFAIYNGPKDKNFTDKDSNQSILQALFKTLFGD